MIAEVLELIGLGLIASVKFLYAPAAIYAAGHSFLESVVICMAGGCFGVFVFYKMGVVITNLWQKLFPPKRDRNKFNKRSRWIIKIRASYGMYGLSFITPCIISIPIGCLLAAKYYPDDRVLLPVMFSSVLFWSLTLTSITYSIGPIFGG